MKKIEIDPQNWQQLAGYRRNILLTGADLHSPGSRVQLVTINPGDTIGEHTHKTSHELYCVLQGECTLVVDGQEITLRQGMLLTKALLTWLLELHSTLFSPRFGLVSNQGPQPG
jgi:mannose-6-phosphate isomerase-like protein (cupin superfamily)